MHDKILILDFGSQYTQLIARRVREAQVYCEIHPCDVADAFVREFAPRGHHPLRRPHLGLRGADRRARRRRCSSSACRCSASATACRPWRSSSAARSRLGTVREFGYAEVRARGHSRLLDGIQDRAQRRGPRPARRVDEPRRQGRRAAAGLQADRHQRRLPDRRHGRRGAPLLRRAVPPRGHAHAAGHGDPAALRARDLRLPRRLEHAATSSPRRSRASASRSAGRR